MLFNDCTVSSLRIRDEILYVGEQVVAWYGDVPSCQRFALSGPRQQSSAIEDVCYLPLKCVKK